MEPAPTPSRVKVIIRVRPLIKEELDSRPDAKVVIARVHPEGKHITLMRENMNDREFAFDQVFPHDKSSQENFYSNIGSPLVEELFNGYNATIIAYGQVNFFIATSSTKTSRPAQGKLLQFSGGSQQSTA